MKAGRLWRAVAAAFVLAAFGAAEARAGELVTIAVPDSGGEVPAKWLGYPGPPKANVLLPTGYDPAKEYPLMLLLHGFRSDYTWWVQYAKADQVLKDLQAIVVMPEGAGGWYTDWWNDGRRSSPAWESYLLEQVVPQVRRRYRLRPERRYHAIVGVSMGGLGATYLGGRLPGYFGSVAAISGATDIEVDPAAFQSFMGAAAGADKPDQVVGPPGGFYARGHNPRRLAANLAQSRVFVGYGDGTLSERGAEPGNEANAPTAVATERLTHTMNESYVPALRAAGVDVTAHEHPGIHDAPDFRYDLANVLRWDPFAPVAEQATSWVNDTVASRGEIWDVGYRFDPPPDGVVRLRRSGSRVSLAGARTTAHLSLPGACTATVRLPATVELPDRPCAATPPPALSLRITPVAIRRGRRTTLRVRVTPAVPGARVRIGASHTQTDARGRALLRACFFAPSVTASVTAPGHRPGKATLTLRGPARRCRR